MGIISEAVMVKLFLFQSLGQGKEARRVKELIPQLSVEGLVGTVFSKLTSKDKV